MAAPADPGFGVPGLDIEIGTLPARNGGFVRVEFTSTQYPDDSPGDAAPHPALLALVDHVEDSGSDQPLIRQVGLLDDDGAPTGIDLTVSTARLG